MKLETVLHSLTDLTRDAIVICEAEPVAHPGPLIVWCNRAMETTTGYSKAELLGQSPRILQGDGTSNATRREIRACLENWNSGRFELLNYRKTGEPFWVELDITPIADETGWYWYWVSVQRDITARKETELQREETLRALKQTKERLDLAIRGSSDGLWDWDLATDTVFFSQRIFDMVGDTHASQANSLSWWEDRCHPEDLPAVQRKITNHIRDGETYDALYRVRHEDGGWRWWRSRGEAIRDRDGRATRFIGFNSDVTELREASQRAEEANRAKSQFLATISHEIRTPMNGFLGLANMLADTPLSDKQRDMLGVMIESGELLVNVIDDILDFSKIETGEFEISHTAFDLTAVLRSTEALWGLNAEAKGLGFSINTDIPGPRDFVGDPSRIRQVLNNVISNAIKFTDRGEVTVHTEVHADGGHPRLVFAVTDTGPGISEEAAERLFTPFMQSDASDRRRHGGAGLGLAICRELCRRMGGDIRYDGEHETGARFVFDVEVEYAEHAAFTDDPPGPPSEEPGGSGAPLRILVAEDNSVNQLVIKTMLEALEAEVSIVENGREAVDAWAGETFDIILMDIQMPVMSGVDAIREIRAREAAERRSRTPIVVVSANVMPQQINDYNAAGADDCVAKPIRPDVLFAAIMANLTETEAVHG